MTDVGAAEIGNGAGFAPVPHDLFFGLAEIGIVGRDLAAAAKFQARDFADVRARGYVKKGTIDGIHGLRNIFEQKGVSRQIRFERCADNVRENGEIERGDRLSKEDRGLQGGRIALNQEF